MGFFRELNRAPSTISREIKRNYSKKAKHYHPWRATILYITRRKCCVRKKVISSNSELEKYIVECLEKYWSPEIISAKCKEKDMPVSFVTIYRAIKAGELPNITEERNLRRRGKLKYKHGSVCQTIHPEHTIHERPQIIENKGRIGDWEGDTVCGGKGKGCIVTLVERKSQIIASARSDNQEAQSVRKALCHALELMEISIPIKSITLDNGSEFAQFKELEKDLCATIYFADPHSPWQRQKRQGREAIRKNNAYIYLAAEHTLSSPDTAFRVENGVYGKILIELATDEYICIVELRLKSVNDKYVIYE